MYIVGIYPKDINKLATDAEMKDEDVIIKPKDARIIAELWQRDIEKIAYLESLLLRK